LGFLRARLQAEYEIMVKKKILKRKHTYWHQLAKAMLQFGLKPTIVGHIIKDVFPETEVNGRHIGAYKRRLIKDGELTVPPKPTMSRNEASQLAKELVSTEDMFIYQCVIGSTKNSLKCFEFKFKAEDKDILKGVDEWITAIQ
tara:strand:- start:66 stop:494 length:429 start_codon:yes stop_codon:yes gene_type:complete